MWKMKVPNYSNKVPPYKIWDMELCTHFLWIGITVFVMDWKFVVGQSLSHVRLFVTPWTAACRDSLSFTISQSLFKLMSIVSMMPSNHLILCQPLLLLSSVFPQNQGLFQWIISSHQVVKGSELQHQSFQWVFSWFALGLTDLISLLSKGLSSVFSSTIRKHQFFSTQHSLWSNSHICIWLLEKP